MESKSVRDSHEINGGKSENKETFGLPDERGIGMQIYAAALLVMDILILNLKMLLVYFEFVYRIFRPVELKPVKGSIVFISGTGHGIGRELALQFGELQCTVVCVDINEKGNQETVQDVKNRGGKAYGYVCDVSNREKVQELAKKIRQEVGEVTILVNNAGIMPCKKFLDHTEPEIKKLFDVNVFAHFWTIEAFLPSMINRNHGHIVALSSMAGVVGLENIVPYCGSKFAVRGFMEALHEEIRVDERNLQVKFTTIFPYIVNTGLCQKPRIRFPSLLAMVDPTTAATVIIDAMRRNKVEVSIPSSVLYLNNWLRVHPNKSALLVKDFIDSGLDAHV